MNSSTSTSKRWLCLYLLTLLCSVGIGWIYTTRFEPETQFWAKAFEERRGEIVEGPKVIFTGDSACSFGVNPQLFSEETGFPTYNLGGTRQMGTRVFMSEALKHATKGDVIVLIANPILLASEAEGEGHTKAGARMALALSEKLGRGEFVDATRPGFNHLLSLGAKIALRMPMFRYGEGDHQPDGQVITEMRDHPAPTLKEFDLEDDFLKVEAVLKRWGERCREQGVSLCYLLPVELTDASILEDNRRKKGAFLDALKKGESGVKIIKTPQEGCSDEEAVYADTLFHFTEEGAEDFTRRLVPILAEVLEDREPS